ncbi:MAG: hypothetical protein NVS2B7_10280 [Herpetosiphon sp.]
MTPERAFGQWLKQRRKALDLTQEELAERVGCAVETIRKIEAGQRRPSRDIAEHIAQELVTDPDERVTVVRLARALGPVHVPIPESDASRAHNLPRPATLFIGRERDVALVVDLLGRPHVRLVTLTGPGGTGKTRLAIEAARRLSDDFAQGVAWVPLAAIPDPELVPAALARALGVQEIGGLTINQRLHEFLRDKDLLLVLDNFEQVVRAAPLLAALLQAAPALKLLVTSRIMLRLAAEHEVPVPPLALPPAGVIGELATLTQYEAVALFIQQAQAILPDFQVTNATAPAVAEICHRLDGLPLAIELAAARSKLFTPQALLKHLRSPLKLLTGGARDAAGRQQTLRATIGWSYDLLSVAEQQLFAHLAIFAGGWTLDAAETICISGGDQDLDVVDGLQALLDQSLIRYAPGQDDEPRFAFLETIREYALERLAVQDTAGAVRERHTAYYLQLARQAEPVLWGGPDQVQWLTRLETDHDNLRAVLHGALRDNTPEVALVLAGMLWRFWLVHGHLLEGQRWLERGLAADQSSSRSIRAKALCGLGSLGSLLPDGTSHAVTCLEEGVALFRTQGTPQELAMALRHLGYAYHWIQNDSARARVVWQESVALGRAHAAPQAVAYSLMQLGSVTGFLDLDYPRARALLEDSIVLFRRVQDQYGLAFGLMELGRAMAMHLDWDPAVAILEECLQIAGALQNAYLTSTALGSLATCAFWHGDMVAARSYLTEAIALARDQGIPANGLYELGWMALLEGKHAEALDCFTQLQETYHALGNQREETNMICQCGWVYLDQGSARDARWYFSQCLERQFEDTTMRARAELLNGLAGTAELEGQPERAAQIIGAVEGIYDAGGRLLPSDEVLYHRYTAATRARLGAGELADAWAAGYAMTPEQAVAYARDGAD